MTDFRSYEKIAMNTDELDDGSVVINFDVTDDYNIVTRTGGYVMVRQDNDDECFYVATFNLKGDVVSESSVPFEFHKNVP
jgi:hypothetical protein